MGVVAETLAGMNIAYVNFDGRYVRTANGISKGHAGMGVGAGIENDAVALDIG